MEIEQQLIRAAQRLMTGATVHSISGWILGYATLAPDTSKSRELKVFCVISSGQ